ncbi:type 1 fimbrial protein [Pectobacterium parmentieri]|uniref:Type 1 fimbrial protein n=1 Tax=Pectobacterium parmentieri TaxID=1905730 RepID=A0A0H3I2R2_PECPM|nr:type 1 fimbrial protein [Pectobacterium parmentieri]AFI89679.1 Hypothetical protein W5S_1587 [Pectobacterium parmentieri]MBI0472098.1 type 1 fimbrial protein [Pectobacterium parmentieri]MBI0495869.1 type 1 fimbrial protein [Pectobacterium parmentieri]MBI0556259.1 type 1 fimbrial protein [Pectobacterium parmentieri]MBI0569343.1 type 1 fimbrial protein [Pectobacterium parmentieri]
MTDKRVMKNGRSGMGLWQSSFVGLLLSSAVCMSADAEIFLPMNDISLSGRVVVPACTVRFDSNHLSFKSNQMGDVASQYRYLSLSRCDVKNVSIVFSAQTWPGYPDRGVLKSLGSKLPSSNWHYRIAPAVLNALGQESNRTCSLTIAAESPKLEKDSPIQGNNPEGRYFNLNGGRYLYEMSDFSQKSEEWIIPFLVSVHRTTTDSGDVDDLDAVFALQLTYR